MQPIQRVASEILMQEKLKKKTKKQRTENQDSQTYIHTRTYTDIQNTRD